ncbi:hypothetical protein MSKU3_0620 [Komagataeibacter oboediens]|nr:hypothetical protein MSKU3_0620 [Komagataeibacter oboediens]
MNHNLLKSLNSFSVRHLTGEAAIALNMIISISVLLFPKQIMVAMPGNKGVSHFASLMKYAVTF